MDLTYFMPQKVKLFLLLIERHLLFAEKMLQRCFLKTRIKCKFTGNHTLNIAKLHQWRIFYTNGVHIKTHLEEVLQIMKDYPAEKKTAAAEVPAAIKLLH